MSTGWIVAAALFGWCIAWGAFRWFRPAPRQRAMIAMADEQARRSQELREKGWLS